jgi:hexosaminidase
MVDSTRWRAKVLISCLGLLMIGCSSSGPPAGHEIAVEWEALDNRSRLTLTNDGDRSLGKVGWTLYFNSMTPFERSVDPRVEVEHVNGSFYRLSPTAAFDPIAPGGSLAFELDGSRPAIKRSDAPGGFYFVFANRLALPERVGSTTIGPFLRDPQTVPTPASRFENNRRLTRLPAEQVDRIVPTPSQIRFGSGQLTIDERWEIHYQEGLDGEAAYLASALAELLGERLRTTEGATPGERVIRLKTVPRLEIAGGNRRTGDEAYALIVSARSGIEVSGTDPAGVFYGIQSLRSLLPVEPCGRIRDSITVDEVTVADAPRFAYRGMHLDVARNFKSRQFVEKLLELMAFYKLNKFHFHLTDDEGWRFAVAALPELTEVGGRRGHTEDELDRLLPSYGSGPATDPSSSSGTGYYTRDELIEILRYAAKRHIEVIPEIDFPGHARAAIKSMDARRHRLLAQGRADEAQEYALSDPEDRSQYRSAQGWTDNVIDVCHESSYRFVETVVDEIVSLYREAGAPLTTVHIGGDEVPDGAWQGSGACGTVLDSIDETIDLHGHFVRRVRRILAERGLVTAGWEEIALEAVADPDRTDTELRVYAWNSVWGWGGEENAYRLANAGYPVVLSNASNLYFDLAYDKDPEEPGLYWAGFVDTRAPFEFTPHELYKSARVDRMGNAIAPEAYRASVRLTEAGRSRILGIQGQLWGELTPDPASAEYMAFPKLLGLAERAWARQPAWARIEDPERRAVELETAWNRFANVLGQRELARLDCLAGGVNYRIPPPGVVIENGRLQANTAFPGLTIRYTTDGSEPDSGSTVYQGPAAVSGPVTAKVFDSRGRGSRSSLITP